MKIFRVCMFCFFFISIMSGCLSGFNHTIVKHPDSPLLLIEVEDSEALVGIYDKEFNKIIKYGWIDLNEVVGHTIIKFNWEYLIKKEKEHREMKEKNLERIK